MSGFDILSLVGEPWNDSASLFRGIGVSVTDAGSLPSSKFLDFVLNGASIYSVLKTGETIISNAAGTSLGGIKLAGNAGEMALTSQINASTGSPAEVLHYAWEDPAHVGNDPASGSMLQGMGASNFSIEGAAKITHIAGSSAYAWSGVLGTRLNWTGTTAATSNGRTIDFNNVGQVTRASPIVSVSAANAADDLIHFGLSDGTNWSVAAKIDAAGRGQFQMLDLPEQGAPGDPVTATARVYGKNVGGVTKVAFRDSTGTETVLGAGITAAGGTVTTNTPVANFSQTWNEGSTTFSAVVTNVTDSGSRGDSRLLDLQVNSGTVFQVRKTGEAILSNTAGTSLGGIKLAGNAGEMALTSLIDPNTGFPADVVRYYWENSAHVGAADPSSGAILRGMGGNRFSIESNATLVHIANNGRFEFEGYGAPRLGFVGFEIASASGKPFDFTNAGQSPIRSNPVMSVSVADPSDDPLHICYFSNSAWTTLARFDGTGALYTPRVQAKSTTGTAPGFTARLDTDNQDRASIGVDAQNRGAITLGIGGNTPPDIVMARDVLAGTLGIRNGSAPVQVRIYNRWENDGANSEFWNMTWRFSTTLPWASIRTAATGNGVVRNMSLEAPLTGFGAPTGDASNIPALKHVGAQLQVRLGSDSDFASIRGRLTTADTAVPGTIVPNKTLILYDANGTAYKVPCVAA